MNEIEAKRKELEDDIVNYERMNSKSISPQARLEMFNLGVEMARKEFEDKISNSKMWITQRIANEYRKHPNLDWALLASTKIVSELKQSLSDTKEKTKDE